MGVGGEVFDGMIVQLIIFGFLCGVVVSAVAWLLWHFVFQHLHVIWK